MTDAELVELARAGNVSAFGELVDRHRAAAFRTALAVCRSHHDAEEVAQDAFVAAWHSLDGFRGDAQFKTWILAIAWKRALSRRRSIWQRLRRVRSNPDSELDVADGSGSAEDALLAGEFGRSVARLVAGLPSKLRDPLLLMATGQWTYAELAAVVGVPEGTLKWRVMEARRQLKRKLQALGYGMR